MKRPLHLHLASILLLSTTAGMGAATANPDGVVFFEKNIRPILIQRCYECHSMEKGKSKGGLLLDSREALLKGGDNGPSITIGHPDKSLLVESVRYKNQDLQMPPKGALPAHEVSLLEQWVKMGAPDPRTATASTAKNHAPRVIDIHQGAKHWAFQTISKPTPPQSSSTHPVDAFIEKKLAEKGLPLSPETDPRTLIRRMTFDLTGLPPTPQEVSDFVEDSRSDQPAAISRLIDRLLASPHYGEKWGRHWLDVARYADSNGLDENIALGTAWRYRDYVVAAFNNDLPFDRFITEQIAGDLLPSQSISQRQRQVTATGFLNLGAKVLAEPDKAKLTMDVVDEQIDVLGRAFMGMTLGCVRCHDHKFDPISQDDYYALAAIFKSTRSFSADRIGALSTTFEAPMGDLDAYAKVKSAERVLSEHQSAVSKLVTEANKVLKDEVRRQAVTYLITAAQLPRSPTLSQVRPIAEKAGLRPHILLNTRVWLAANESHAVFKPWQDALKAKGSVSHLREYYLLLFSKAEKITPPPAKKNAKKGDAEVQTEEVSDTAQNHESITVQARAALDDARGFLALPPEPEILYPKAVLAQLESLRDVMMSTQSNLPDLPTALAVADDQTILKELPIHIRGSHLSLGKPVKRGVPQVMQVALKGPQTFPEKNSGRIELARWLAHAEHPLTSRVIVNRVWGWHFNQALVPTADNFGLLGQKPTHPELLDYLARWFTQNGWSMKALHRHILTSKTYQRSSQATDPTRLGLTDPENRLLSYFPIRRLEAEEIRDALLQTAGSLDTSPGGKSIPRRNREFVFNHTSKDLTTYSSTRRALYLPIIRNNLYDLFQQFDYPDPATSTGMRGSSIVSPQALLLMNSALSTQAAESFARSLISQTSDTEERVQRAVERAYSRPVTEADLRRARDFLTTADAALASSQPDPAKRELQAWSLLSQGMLMSSEFIYLR